MKNFIIIAVIALFLIEAFITHAATIFTGIIVAILIVICFWAVFDFILNRFPEDEKDVADSELTRKTPSIEANHVNSNNALDMAKENLDLARKEYNSAMSAKWDINSCGRTMLNARTKLIEIGNILAGYNSPDDIEELNTIIYQKDKLIRTIDTDLNVKIRSIVNNHYEMLKHSISKDPQKKEFYCDSFRSSVLNSVTAYCDQDVCDFAYSCYHNLKEETGIKENADSTTSSITDKMTEIDAMSGQEFERFCATLLRLNGFNNVNLTKASGDQGVDILAEKDGIKYAFQCKNYSSDLGNTPVQEVNTGRMVYDCHVGVVMTNREFTEGAKLAASKSGVLLWDRNRLREMIQFAEQHRQKV